MKWRDMFCVDCVKIHDNVFEKDIEKTPQLKFSLGYLKNIKISVKYCNATEIFATLLLHENK